MKNKNRGFIMADFLFAFTLVLGIGIFIFALTFSLATVEIAQYLIWSAARTYSAANFDETTASQFAKTKFNNLTAQFPLLTGNGASDSVWFELPVSTFKAGNLAIGTEFAAKVTASDLENKSGTESRQPWIGATAKLNLKLFKSIKLPFLGKIVSDSEKFNFEMYAFVIRNPSFQECKSFFSTKNRFDQGLNKLENFSSITGLDSTAYTEQEDNGC